MKKQVLIYFLMLSIVSFILLPHVFALTPTANPTGTNPTVSQKQDVLVNQINQLKEKIASRVAELNLVEKRGVIGTVSDVSANQISITDITGKTRYVDVDEITKFSSSQAKKSFGLSDLTKGTRISVLGLYN